MNFLRKRYTDPDDIIREFQKRQKQVVIAAMACFAVMVPLVIHAPRTTPYPALKIFAAFAIPLLVFYFWTYRCPACGARVQQRRRMLRMAMRCRRCEAKLDDQPLTPR